MDNPNIHQYRVQVKVGNINKEKDSNAPSLLQEELSMRPHLISSDFVRTDHGEHFEVYFVVITYGIDISSVSEDVTEEILEVGSAILNHIEGVTVEVQNIELI